MPESKERNRGVDMKKSVKIIAAVIAALVIVAAAAAGVILFFGAGQNEQAAQSVQKQEEADPIEAEEEYQELQGQVVEEKEDPYESVIDFEALWEINPDVYAWIQIPGTNIDYPILQSVVEADEYYLNTTIDGKTGYPGSIYTEKYNATDFSDPVTVVYGHNMKEGTMFSDLHNYTDRAFFDQNAYIYIYLPDRTLKYQIFAAVAFDDRYLLGNYNFRDPADFQTYLDELRSSIDGNVNNEVQVTQDSTILTLSTCIGEYPDQRWLVNATLVEVEE